MEQDFQPSFFQKTITAGIAAQIEISRQERDILRKIIRSKTLGVVLHDRAQIVLAAADKLTNLQIQAQYGLEEHRVAPERPKNDEDYLGDLVVGFLVHVLCKIGGRNAVTDNKQTILRNMKSSLIIGFSLKIRAATVMERFRRPSYKVCKMAFVKSYKIRQTGKSRK